MEIYDFHVLQLWIGMNKTIVAVYLELLSSSEESLKNASLIGDSNPDLYDANAVL